MVDPRFLSQAEEDGAGSRFASAAAGLPVLVTGAGGYIGSALAKAIAAAGPARLVLLDSSEQNLFEIHSRLEGAYAHVPHEAILGSVTDASLLNGIFSRFRPRIVYHAAALKHVPLLELNPLAAVRNNAIGTYTLAEAARHHGVSTLVLVKLGQVEKWQPNPDPGTSPPGSRRWAGREKPWPRRLQRLERLLVWFGLHAPVDLKGPPVVPDFARLGAGHAFCCRRHWYYS